MLTPPVDPAASDPEGGGVRRLRVLLSAYACSPLYGSEPALGWGTAREMAKHHEVWVLTQSRHRSAIEAELARDPVPGLRFAYYELPRWVGWFRRGQRGVRLHSHLWQIGALRLAAGFGIGGALPSATTTTAEFTPARHRTMAVTATITCVPLGGMVAGLFAGSILPTFGWRGLFWVGGLLPIALSLVLLLLAPESPRFMARVPVRWGELAALLRRMGRNAPPEAAFSDKAEQRVETRAGVSALFAAGRTRDTLALWGSCFLCLLAVYSAFSWLPTMLAAQGLDTAVAGSGLTAYNLGGVIGALACAAVIARYGSRWPQVACALGATASALALEHTGLGNQGAMVFWLGLHGLFVNAVQSTLYAVAAFAYPTNIRATGTATALAFGRLGAVLSAFVGAAVISAAGPNSYLDVLAFAMLGTAGCLLLLGRHIPSSPRPLVRRPGLAHP